MSETEAYGMSETDTLLPKDDVPTVSLRDVWRRSASLWLVVGAGGALVAGYATAATCVLYGRVLDAMARATLVGVDETLTAYVRLAMMELLATWVQFVAWSHMARAVATSDDGVDERTVSYVEALGAVWHGIGVGVTSIAIALQYGWDALLVVLVAAVGLTMSSFVVVKWMTQCFLRRRNEADDGSVETPAERTDAIEREVEDLWCHARSLRRLGATETAVGRVRRLLDDPARRSHRLGFMVAMLSLMTFPIVVTFVYTAWKVGSSSPRDPSSAVNVMVVFLASGSAFSSLQRAWTTYQKGDITTDETCQDGEAGDAERMEEAATWIRTIAAPYMPRSVSLVVFAMGFASSYVALGLVLAYSTTWLLHAPYEHAALCPTAWTLAIGIVVSGAVVGLQWDLQVRATSTTTRHVYLSIFSAVFAARLEATEPAVPLRKLTAKKLLEDTTVIGMYASSSTEPSYLSTAVTAFVGIVAGLALDPWVTAAILVLCPFTYAENAVYERRNKSLYRSFASSRTAMWPVALSESLLRAVLHTAASVSTIAMVYLQTKWVAQGTSSLVSVLSVLGVSSVLFSVAHASRFTAGMFLKDKALTAAAALHEFIQQRLPSSDDSLERIDHTQLEGDLVLCLQGDDEEESVRVRPGERVTLEPSLVEQVERHVFDDRLEGFAVIGGVDLSRLSRSRLGDRVMVINDDPLRLPGSIEEDINLSGDGAMLSDAIMTAAQAAGLSVDELGEQVTFGKWHDPTAAGGDVKAKIPVARVLLRRPVLLMVEAISTEDGVLIDVDQCVERIRARLPNCRVIDLTREGNI